MNSATIKNILHDQIFHHRQLKNKFNMLNSNTHLRSKCQISETQSIKHWLSKYREHVINKQNDKESEERLRTNKKEAIFIELFHKNPATLFFVFSRNFPKNGFLAIFSG
jgi:hypothetical protein